MPFIRDEGKRMKAYLVEAAKICNGFCGTCPTKDELIYSDPTLIEHMRKYGLEGNSQFLSEKSCSLGFEIGKRMTEYGLNNPSAYQRFIISSAKRLQENSIGKVNPEGIRSCFGFLRAYISLDEEQSQMKKRSEENSTAIRPSLALPPVLSIAKISTVAKRELASFGKISF